MSRDNADGYWSDLVAFHQQEAETARAEATRIRAVIAEIVAVEKLMVIVFQSSQTPANRGRVEHSKDLLRLLAQASQTGEGEGQ